jgi:hypothetical protein
VQWRHSYRFINRQVIDAAEATFTENIVTEGRFPDTVCCGLKWTERHVSVRGLGDRAMCCCSREEGVQTLSG